MATSFSQAQVLFDQVADDLGIEVTSNIDLGSGVSFCDFNGDGWDDLTFATQEGIQVRFFENTGGGFNEVFLIDDTPLYTNKQVIWVDIDNDGDKDFFTANAEFPNVLYENVAGELVDITAESGLPTVSRMTQSRNWGDYAKDGYLDLFLSSRDPDQIISNQLFRNNGDNTFTDVTLSSGIGEVSELTFQGTFFDYNNDGHLDLYLINDRAFTRNILYRNNGDGTFSDVSVESGADYRMDAMSVALEDYDADGYIDVYITNVFAPSGETVGNVLMKNNGDGTFSNQAVAAEVRFDTWSWGANWTDADNDGFLDLYVSGASPVNTATLNAAALYVNDGDGTFTEENENGFEEDLANSFGNALGDFNNDGYQDIVVTNHFGHLSYLWENQSYSLTANNYIALKMQGVASNRDGAGARIVIMSGGQKQDRVVALGESYLSQNSNTEIIGLGNQGLDYVQVIWPSGTVDYYDDITPNQRLTLIEGVGYLSANTPMDQSGFAMYPNPAVSQLNLLHTGAQIEVVRIYNTLGQLILNQRFDNANSQQLEVGHLTPGAYWVEVLTDSGRLTKKLIKQ
ncbi:FG-GAP-like repeat-containing protein [Gilvibacter sp.]|uniref:FG-GAP-like repeat-containing protein n=1 Tax=Gilvibacter sp. TaxID=2729997 RepID=UPI0025BE43BC|nr:FG-GAP-like repeat-containing protein [Gilvibacter sp.]NQX78134.1 VCBS repeat-containing protein [Gilvibacter sp.]